MRMLTWNRKVVPFCFLLPAFLLIMGFLVLPLLYSFYLGFTSFILTRDISPMYVGLKNYQRAIFGDDMFWRSLRITLVFTFVSVGLEFFIGLAVALLLDCVTTAKRFVRTTMLLPMMMTPVVVGLMWRFLWDSRFGLINYFLSRVGLPPVQWIASPKVALISVILTDVWQNSSFAILIFLATLQVLPDDLYEAAGIDGASSVQSFWYLTLPLLKRAMLIVLVIRTLFAFRIFDTVYVLTDGGPADATLSLSIYVQRVAFRYFDLGYSSAISWVMLILCVALSYVYIRVLAEER